MLDNEKFLREAGGWAELQQNFGTHTSTGIKHGAPISYFFPGCKPLFLTQLRSLRNRYYFYIFYRLGPFLKPIG